MELHPILDVDTAPNPGWWYVLSTLGDSPSERVGHTATYIKGSHGNDAGKVYIIGGANPSSVFGDTYVLDLNTLQWDTVDGAGLRARYEHMAFVPESQPNKIYIFGGADQAGNMNDIQCLDTTTNVWSTITVMGTPPPARTYHTVPVCGDKLIVYSGGHSGSDPVGDRQVHCFDANTSSWVMINVRGDSPKPRHGHVMAAVGDKIFVHGGMAGSTFYDDLHVLDLSKNSWVNVKRKKTYPSARAGHGSLVCGTDLYIFGGMNRDGALDDTYKLDTVKLAWTKVDIQGPPPPSRLDFAMCAVTLNRDKHSAGDTADIANTSQHAKEVLEQELKPGSASSRDSHQEYSRESSSIEDFSSDVVLDQNQSSVVHASGSDNSVSVDEPAASMDQQKTLKICLIHGGMDTQGEIFDDTLVLLLEQKM
ncbi:rab9 effector protein with kelch motifs-like [Gigantopelta aegis]|uniref:rab9 effector protein with kelch motifs-like n=1 Tax=Gigantopelta aegis TaxID=1735272 RepID=UPI001B888D30|nr:rab9 effector protein with kelch motifs-like [Gigantopelta aegis]